MGYRRLLRINTISTKQMRIRFDKARGPLCINELGVYYAANAKEPQQEKAAEVKGMDYSVASNTADAVTLDLGKAQTVSACFYQPDQTAAHEGMISNYELYLGMSTDKMEKVAEGEFSNIRNNPMMQEVYFTPTTARYVTLRATRMVKSGEAIKYEKLVIK